MLFKKKETDLIYEGIATYIGMTYQTIPWCGKKLTWFTKGLRLAEDVIDIPVYPHKETDLIYEGIATHHFRSLHIS